jgi:hypothetical protein
MLMTAAVDGLRGWEELGDLRDKYASVGVVSDYLFLVFAWRKASWRR